MSIKKLNEFFSYSFFILGAIKLVLVVLVLMQFVTDIATIFNGGSGSLEYYPTLSTVIGFAQMFLSIGSIIMIILNVKKQPEVISGYLLGLGGVLIQIITPSIMSIFVVFIECGMYMKAGTKIKNKNNIQQFKF